MKIIKFTIDGKRELYSYTPLSVQKELADVEKQYVSSTIQVEILPNHMFAEIWGLTRR
jgi:hypothetical protein